MTIFYNSRAADVVGVFDSSFRQVFPDARPMRALIRETSKFAQHPVESGSVITDNRVILPNSIDLFMILTPATYSDTFQQIRAIYQSGTQLSLRTKVGVYSDLYIEEMPHDEDPEIFDTISLSLKLQQVIFVTAQYAPLPVNDVKEPSNSSTVSTGQKQSDTATTGQSTAAYALFGGG